MDRSKKVINKEAKIWIETGIMPSALICLTVAMLNCRFAAHRLFQPSVHYYITNCISQIIGHLNKEHAILPVIFLGKQKEQYQHNLLHAKMLSAKKNRSRKVLGSRILTVSSIANGSWRTDSLRLCGFNENGLYPSYPS